MIGPGLLPHQISLQGASSGDIGVVTSIPDRIKRLQQRLTQTLVAHPALQRFYVNVSRDNMGMLVGFVFWSILTSIIPLSIGVVAMSSLFIQSESEGAEVVRELSKLFQGVISTRDIETAVKSLSHQRGLLGVIGIGGVVWGASSIGAEFSTAFRVIFDSQPRSFLREKLIDIGMLFAFILLLGAEVIAAASEDVVKAPARQPAAQLHPTIIL